MQDLLEKTRQELRSEGWGEDVIKFALDYAVRWAQGNARVGAAGDQELEQRLTLNYLPHGVKQARQWLIRSRAQWNPQQQ